MNGLPGLHRGGPVRATSCLAYRLRVNQSMQGKERGIVELSADRADN